MRLRRKRKLEQAFLETRRPCRRAASRRTAAVAARPRSAATRRVRIRRRPPPSARGSGYAAVGEPRHAAISESGVARRSANRGRPPCLKAPSPRTFAFAACAQRHRRRPMRGFAASSESRRNRAAACRRFSNGRLRGIKKKTAMARAWACGMPEGASLERAMHANAAGNRTDVRPLPSAHTVWQCAWTARLRSMGAGFRNRLRRFPVYRTDVPSCARRARAGTTRTDGHGRARGRGWPPHGARALRKGRAAWRLKRASPCATPYMAAIGQSGCAERRPAAAAERAGRAARRACPRSRRAPRGIPKAPMRPRSSPRHTACSRSS